MSERKLKPEVESPPPVKEEFSSKSNEGEKILDSMDGFIASETTDTNESITDALHLEDGGYYRMICLSRGKSFFQMEAYNEAIEAFEEAENLGSYQGKFLRGFTMTEISGHDYFAGLQHMLQSVKHMLVAEYFYILRHALETGERLGLITSQESNGEKISADLREISMTIDLLQDMTDDDPQKIKLLHKLLKLLRNYRLN